MHSVYLSALTIVVPPFLFIARSPTQDAVVGAVYLGISAFSPTLGWVFAFPISSVVLGLLVSGIAGIAFGIYPARQAGKKNPIDALRYE